MTPQFLKHKKERKQSFIATGVLTAKYIITVCLTFQHLDSGLLWHSLFADLFHPEQLNLFGWFSNIRYETVERRLI